MVRFAEKSVRELKTDRDYLKFQKLALDVFGKNFKVHIDKFFHNGITIFDGEREIARASIFLGPRLEVVDEKYEEIFYRFANIAEKHLGLEEITIKRPYLEN